MTLNPQSLSRIPPSLLGGLTPARFLREYWQKKPLLIRQALPGFKGLVSIREMRDLAASDEVQARLIVREGKHWSLERGPFGKQRFTRLRPDTPWTLLIQELNFHVPEADRLLDHFQFIPHARVDDVMVSHACAGGGVGPHVDSYDVFLLQGPGRRRWRISGQSDLALVPELPLKILKSFKPEQEWILEPGDMLYLPPNYAHDGVAVDDCFTYSIGFRAPSAQQWVSEFLSDFAERLEWPGYFSDPNLKMSRHPGELPHAMTQFLSAELKRLRFDSNQLTDFNGRYLTDPKPHVFFDPPEETLTVAGFRKQALQRGIRLDPRTRLLYSGDQAWCNGEALGVEPLLLPALFWLADHRGLDPNALKQIHQTLEPDMQKKLWAYWHQWYEDGWLRTDL